jgi:hypothetical protein
MEKPWNKSLARFLARIGYTHTVMSNEHVTTITH